jgi:predicted transcriptional regulator
MAEVKKRDLVESDSILDEEDEATLAAIDRGIKAADEDRVVSFEEVRRRLREWLTKSYILIGLFFQLHPNVHGACPLWADS